MTCRTAKINVSQAVQQSQAVDFLWVRDPLIHPDSEIRVRVNNDDYVIPKGKRLDLDLRNGAVVGELHDWKVPE